MTKALDQLVAEDFRSLVGQNFILNGKPAKLSSVTTRQPPWEGHRETVSLVFNAQTDLDFYGGTYNVSHPEIGEHSLLVTRIVNPTPTYQIILS